MQQREKIRSQIDISAPDFQYKYNKSSYQTIKSISDELSNLLFVYKKQTKY